MVKSGFMWMKSLILVAALATTSTAIAQDAKKPVAKKPVASWVVNCNPTNDGASMLCQMSQTFNEAKSKKRIMAISIRAQPTDKAKRPLMVLALPHGLHFPSGANFKVDDLPAVPITLKTSDPNGVYSSSSLSAKTVAAMKNGDVITITMYAAANKPLAIPVSLVGFTAAFNKIISSD
jgi:invasion protein IalB